MRPVLLVVLALGAGCDSPLELLPSADAAALADGGLPAAGASCSGTCSGGLTCYTMAGTPGNMSALPGGLCSRSCSMTSDCPSGMQCGDVEGMLICLPICDPAGGSDCRSEYSCCSNQVLTSGPGACAPPNSNFCGN